MYLIRITSDKIWRFWRVIFCHKVLTPVNWLSSNLIVIILLIVQSFQISF